MKEDNKKLISAILGGVFLLVVSYLYVREMRKPEPDSSIMSSVGILFLVGIAYHYVKGNEYNKS